MTRNTPVPAAALLSLLSLTSLARADDALIETAAPAGFVEANSHRDTSPYRSPPETRPARTPWKISLAPLVASQALDALSSYGMRELNPILASPDGRFGMKASGIKFSATAVIVGIEYLIVRKHPNAVRVLSKLNWSSSVVTTGFA